MEAVVSEQFAATCGIDWAERHHDVALVDTHGHLVAKRRIADDAAGFQELVALLADAGDSETNPIPVAIETPRGLRVAALRATGRAVYAQPHGRGALSRALERRALEERSRRRGGVG
jgi:Transposase